MQNTIELTNVLTRSHFVIFIIDYILWHPNGGRQHPYFCLAMTLAPISCKACGLAPTWKYGPIWPIQTTGLADTFFWALSSWGASRTKMSCAIIHPSKTLSTSNVRCQKLIVHHVELNFYVAINEAKWLFDEWYLQHTTRCFLDNKTDMTMQRWWWKLIQDMLEAT